MSSPLSRWIAIHQLPAKQRKKRLLYNLQARHHANLRWHETLVNRSTWFFAVVSITVAGFIGTMNDFTLAGMVPVLAIALDLVFLHLALLGASSLFQLHTVRPLMPYLHSAS